MVQQRMHATPDFVCALLFILVWSGILALRTIPIGGSWNAVDPDTLTLVTLWVGSVVIFTLAGGWVGRRTDSTRQQKERAAFLDRGRAVNIGLVAMSSAAMVGAVLIIFEFSVIRGYGFSTPVSVIRIEEVNRYLAGSTSSLISGPGRLMMPAIMPAIVLAICFWRSLSFSTLLIFSLACCAVLLEQTMFEGGRLFIGATFIVTAISLFSCVLVPDGTAQARKITVMVSILTVFGLVMSTYFGWIFVSRFQGGGENLTAAYSRFSELVMDEGMIDPEAPLLPSLTDTGTGTGTGFVDTVLAANPAIKFFWLYATHGISQLGSVIRFDYSRHTNGFFSFPQIAQILDRLFSTNLAVHYFSGLPSVGLYTTLIGSVFIDFGYFGSLVFAAIFGFTLGFTAQKGFFQQEPSFSKMAFPLLAVVAVFSPMVSIVNHMWPALAWALVASLLVTLKRRPASRASVPAPP